MEIIAKGLSKRFGGQWLFKDLNQHFAAPGGWAITGANGSGKTTLLHILAGMIPPSQGTIEYKVGERIIDSDMCFKYLWLAAPYMELFEEFTLEELLRFHFQFKPLMAGLSLAQVAERCQLSRSLQKPVSKFSSGMKQRIKLAMGIFSDAPVLLLDEPTTNLDQQGFAWYHQEVSQLVHKRLVIICSNQPQEYEFCQQTLSLSNLIT